jgi:hypothetical protein
VTEPEDAERLVAAFPIGARETARCPLYEAVDLLKTVRGRAVEDDALGARVLLVTRYGETTKFRLRDVPTDDDGDLRAASPQGTGERAREASDELLDAFARRSLRAPARAALPRAQRANPRTSAPKTKPPRHLPGGLR